MAKRISSQTIRYSPLATRHSLFAPAIVTTLRKSSQNALSRLPTVSRRAAPARRADRHQPARRIERRRQGDEAELCAQRACYHVQQQRYRLSAGGGCLFES